MKRDSVQSNYLNNCCKFLSGSVSLLLFCMNLLPFCLKSLYLLSNCHDVCCVVILIWGNQIKKGWQIKENVKWTFFEWAGSMVGTSGHGIEATLWVVLSTYRLPVTAELKWTSYIWGKEKKSKHHSGLWPFRKCFLW